MSKDEIVSNIAYDQLILTREFLNQMENLYADQQARIAVAIGKIRSGVPFGYENCYGDYCPCKLVEVLDPHDGIIRYHDCGTGKIEEDNVMRMVIG